MDDHEFKRQVRDLAASPVFSRLFSVLDELYVTRWRNAQTLEEREEAHRLLKAASDLRAEITYIANDARISAFNRRLSGDNL